MARLRRRFVQAINKPWLRLRKPDLKRFRKFFFGNGYAYFFIFYQTDDLFRIEQKIIILRKPELVYRNHVGRNGLLKLRAHDIIVRHDIRYPEIWYPKKPPQHRREGEENPRRQAELMLWGFFWIPYFRIT